jgi:uncharacterized membrane protein YfcA
MRQVCKEATFARSSCPVLLPPLQPIGMRLGLQRTGLLRAAPCRRGSWDADVSAGILAGFIIGVVASLLGVAGGEFLIPTLVLLFGADIKLAGSLSLAVSLPTMLVGFTRYSRDQSFSVLRQNWIFLLVIAAGSIVGTFVGGRLLGLISEAVLRPLLAGLLVVSAIKVWRHK